MSDSKFIAPSLLSANFLTLGDDIKAVEEAGADLLHIDIMDGHFVPNLTIGPFIVEQIKSFTKLPLDVHLMVENPHNWIDKFAKIGVNFLTVHYETEPHLNRVIKKIKEHGIKAGVSLNPSTHPLLLEYVLEIVDLVLVMSVNPGFGGQSFIENSFKKIEWLNSYREKNRLNFLIEVDGGVNEGNIDKLSKAGADIFVAGSAIFSKNNYKIVISTMRNRL